MLFGVVVFIHEFGHFLFAKIFKIRVNEFALGFGPALFKFTKGETQYALRVLPFGGYCAMEGENEGSTDQRAFCNANVWKRVIVVAAGAVFNIILGFLIMWGIVFMLSSYQGENLLATTTVAGFAENATSDDGNGLKKGDKILAINSRRIYSHDDINYMLQTDEDGVVQMDVSRDGDKVRLDKVTFQKTKANGVSYIASDIIYLGERCTFLTSIRQSFWRTISMARMIWMSLGDLITGKYGLNEISGPIGVTQIVSDAVTKVANTGLAGMIYLFQLMCLITVNLGIFNLLPIPALDGSRVLFLIIEGIRGKPVKHEALVHTIGMVALMAFMVLIVFKDLWSWIF